MPYWSIIAEHGGGIAPSSPSSPSALPMPHPAEPHFPPCAWAASRFRVCASALPRRSHGLVPSAEHLMLPQLCLGVSVVYY